MTAFAEMSTQGVGPAGSKIESVWELVDAGSGDFLQLLLAL